MLDEPKLSISHGQKLQLKHNPTEYVEFIGEIKKFGKNIFIKVRYPNGSVKLILYDQVLPIEENSQNALEQVARGCFGRIDDLKRLITFEKLKGTLNEIIYSMEAAQVDFYPYQFKPVLKFIRSPLQRLILADEVGLGKTIESGLIWIEMQARRQAKRLLVICPPTLADKWEMELKDKFLIDAIQVDFTKFEKKFKEFEKNGIAEEFALISTYQALRPPKSARDDLRHAPEAGNQVSNTKVHLLQKMKFWDNPEYFPFDLIIFDEAHYMRNSSTASHMLGEALSSAAQGVLCVSATPINNKNEDLHSLLSLIDANFFSSQSTFEKLININRPTVQLATCLSQFPINFVKLHSYLKEMEDNAYVRNSPLFELLKKNINALETEKSMNFELMAQTQSLVEKLNILGGYINRTQRRQVEENRPIRESRVCTVTYTPIERNFYDAIEENIRRECMTIHSEFSILRVISRQLMAASSLPAYAERLLKKQKPEDCIFEIFGTLNEDEEDEQPVSAKFSLMDIPDPKNLAECDSKFSMLSDIISEYHGERIIIFAYYHDTLSYLFRRLTNLGIKVGMIHGHMPMEERWLEIERFTNGVTQIILSSEVGSEGIDLQCSHILINYDMPWNPMRIEQRIGRIDRVGQESPVLKIINFNIEDTIEQRVYQKLYEKLNIFSDTLGDMEQILGKEIRKLTMDLFTSRLTHEQENQRIAQTAQALYNKMDQMRMLEEQSIELVGLSDYIQRKIEEDYSHGRYIRPDDLENYLKDFFSRYFQGTLIQSDTPAPGCLCVHLTDSARQELNHFMGNDRTRIARDLRQTPLNITFNRTVMKMLPAGKKRNIIFVNHLSPLIRWITSYYKNHGHNLCRTTALNVSIPTLQEGIYVFDVHLWEIEGISSYKKLSYGIRNVMTDDMILSHEAEIIFEKLLTTGKDVIYQDKIQKESIRNHLKILDNELEIKFYEEAERFQAENETTFKIREQRIKNIFLPRIERHKETLSYLEKQGQYKMIPARKGLIRSTERIMEKQLSDLKRKAQFIPQASCIAMGIFFNSHTKV